MANLKKPLSNSNGLIREFGTDDAVPVKHGGTGKSSIPSDHIIVGNNTDEIRTIKYKFDAITAPSNINDFNDGYSIGSKWFDTIHDLVYTCLDSSIGHAVWKAQFDPQLPIDYVEFNQDVGHQVTIGQLAWNDTDKTLDIGLDKGSVLQIGQELLIHIHNESGADISNGSVVYITEPPSPDDEIHVSIASCDDDNAYASIAISTGDIPNGDRGYCTLVGRVRSLNTSTFNTGDVLYLGTNGSITNIPPTFPNHLIKIGYCVKSDATTGIIFVHISNQFAVEDLYNVNITSPTQGDSFIYEDNRWINRNFGAFTKEPTGFAFPEAVTVSYDSTSRTVTVTGADISAYWRSNSVPGLTGTSWTSDPHSAGVTQNQFLYYNGTTFVWDTSFPSFDILSIVTVGYTSLGAYAGSIRECHGTMPWQVHRELHQVIGSYMSGGGDLSSYVLNSTTAGDRRLDISATTINDEDLQTINSALTSNLYSIIYLTGSNTRAYTDDYAEIVPVSGSRPYINTYTGGTWTQTLIDNNNYACIFIVATPRTADTLSQKRRYMFIQPQTQFSTFDAVNNYIPSNLNLGEQTNLFQEFVFIGKIIIRYTGGDWHLIKVEKLTGSRISQIAVSGGMLSIVTHDATLSGDGTASSPLSAVQYTIINSAMMGSATGTLGFFSIHPQNVNPFENALTTSGDIFNNGKLNPIIMPYVWKLTELRVAVGHCAVAQATATTTPTMRIEFFSHTGTTRTSIGSIDVPLNGVNCGVYNNLGSDNFQTSAVTGITTITGNINDLIGWQFTNRGTTNDQINAVAQVTVRARFEKV